MIGPNNRYAKYECLTRLPELIANDAAQPAEPGIGLRRLLPVKIAAAGLDRQRRVEKLHLPPHVPHPRVRTGEGADQVGRSDHAPCGIRVEIGRATGAASWGKDVMIHVG